jgi:energy-coupling factor transporter ATP-binding protein EcfA2
VTGAPSPADVAWHLLTSAAELYRDSPRASRWLVGCLERLADPLRIAVAGQPGVGKSTLVNALAGEHIAPITVSAGIGVVAWFLDGAEPAGAVFPPGAPAVPVPVARKDRHLHIDLRQWQPEQVERVVVEWPARGLRDMALIDTPGDTPAEWLASTVDAVVYATRDPSDADLATLRAAQASDPTGAVTTILALTRADELGAGRIDALSSAKQIARRRRTDPAVHAVSQNVIAVAGLLGQAGRTLREDEFAALRALAGIARAELDAHLLSADRFVRADLPVRLSAEQRVDLLDRFGVFGIRLASTLIRRGADTQSGLAGQLVQRSGLSELRESIGSFFTDRAEVLRARSALAGLHVVLRGEPRPRAAQLAAAAERALAGAHDLAELRLLAALRAGRLTLPGTLADTAERLTGGLGTGITERLGLPADAAPDDVRNAVYDELGQWRAQAESPLLGAAQRSAARTVVRSCEGLLSTLAPPAYR